MTTENTSDPAAPDTIVLVHGLWVTPRSWEHWIEHYEGKGSSTPKATPIFTYLSKYAVGCYLRYRWFPRRTLLETVLKVN